MRDVNKLMMVALAVVMIVPSFSSAEYYGNSFKPSRSKAFSKVQSAGESISGALSGNKSDLSEKEQLEAELEELSKQVDSQIASNEEEKQLREEVAGNTATLNKNAEALTIAGIIEQKAAEEKLKKNEALVDQIRSKVAPAPQASSLDKNVPKECDNGAVAMLQTGEQKFAAFQEPFNQTKGQLAKLKEEDAEEAREALFAKIQGLFDKFKKADKVANRDKKKNIGDDIPEIETRLAFLEDHKEWQEGAIDKSNDQLLSRVFDPEKGLFANLINSNDEASEVNQIAIQSAATFRQFVDSVSVQVSTGARQMEVNCKHNEEKVLALRSVNLSSVDSGNTIIDQFGQAVASRYTNPEQAERVALQEMNSMATEVQSRGLECPAQGQASSVIDGAFANVQAQIANMGGLTDAEALLQAMSDTMTSLSAVQADLGNQLNPSILACRRIVETVEEIKEKTEGVKTQVASATGQGGSRRSSGRSTGLGTTHFR